MVDSEIPTSLKRGNSDAQSGAGDETSDEEYQHALEVSFDITISKRRLTNIHRSFSTRKMFIAESPL